jgi:hypothetical protein
MVRNNNITQAEYGTFQTAYDFFNAELFSGELHPLLITLHRKAHSKGYFCRERFTHREQKLTTHELAMNPDCFSERSDEEILSTLVHEMCHVWQFECGKPPRSGYHDREWAARMKQAGLMPSATGEEGGKETGQRMTHYILPGGVYAAAYKKLEATGLRLHWESPSPGENNDKKQAVSKVKYSCPFCELNAWAKPGAVLICGECYEEDGGIINYLEAFA